MKSLNIEFLRRLLYFSAIIGMVMLFTRLFIPREYFSPVLPFLLIFFMATTMISFMVLVHSLTGRLIKFVNTFLLSTLVKLVLFITVMVGYIFLNRSDAIPFMIAFFLLYLLFTVFEVVFIVRITRNLKGPSTHE